MLNRGRVMRQVRRCAGADVKDMPLRVLEYVPAMRAQGFLFDARIEPVVQASLDALGQAGSQWRAAAVGPRRDAANHIVMV